MLIIYKLRHLLLTLLMILLHLCLPSLVLAQAQTQMQFQAQTQMQIQPQEQVQAQTEQLPITNNEAKPITFNVHGFNFVVNPIHYIETTNQLIPPKLTVFLNKDSVFELNSSPNQVDFTKVMFGTRLEERSEETLNLLGNTRTFFIVATHSGGTYCCYTYYFLELLDNGIRLFQRLDTGSSTISFSSTSNNSYILKFKDESFAGFYASYTDSAFPEVIFAYNPEYRLFGFAASQMKSKINDVEFHRILAKTFSDVKANNEQYGEINITINPILQAAIKLIYQGNFDKVQELVDKTWPASFKTLKKEKFIYDLKCKLKDSRFFTEISQMNPNLAIPNNCESNY